MNDGKLVMIGEGAALEHAKTLLDTFDLLPRETRLRQTLDALTDNLLEGPLPEALSPDETNEWRDQLFLALERLPEKSASHRLIHALYEDVETALHRYGYMPIERAYLPPEAAPNLNDSPQVRALVARHLSTASQDHLFGSDIADFYDAGAKVDEKICFIILDAHLDRQRLAVQNIFIDALYTSGIRTIFSESDRLGDRDFSGQTLLLGGELMQPGHQNRNKLTYWETPRPADALEFFYGKRVSTIGVEDPAAYKRFGALTDGQDFDDYIGALHERSRLMADNIEQLMNRRRIKKSAFILGMAHLDSTAQALRNKGISYVAVMPFDGLHPKALADVRELFSEQD